MLAVVKTPRINLKIEGQIPDWIMVGLKKEFGKDVKISNNKPEEFVRIVDTRWYKDVKKTMTPGVVIKTYRENYNLTQEQLGKKLGGLPRQHISGMENGSRGISKAMAKRISEIFEISIERLI